MRIIWESSAVLVLMLVTTLLTPGTPNNPPPPPPQEWFEDNLLNNTSTDATSDSTNSSTDSSTVSTTDSSTVSTTDSPTVSTTDSSTISTTDSTTESTNEITTTIPTTTTTTTDNVTTTDTESSTSSSLSDLGVYRETKEELNLISEVLVQFDDLVSSADSRSIQGVRGQPVSWWQRLVVHARPLTTSYDFCVVPDAGDLCNTLETQMESTDNLVANLQDDVNGWKESDLEQLRSDREDLEGTYKQASESGEVFTESVKVVEFIQAINEVQQNIKETSDAVQEKIDELDPPDNPGAVALVATLGSVGGVMILSIVGVMIYSAVKQSKTKKKLSPGSKTKVKGENTPIDAYANDVPVGPRPAPRMDPYSQPPAPAPQSHHYGPQYDPRRDPGFPDTMGGRPQRGLRRTNMI